MRLNRWNQWLFVVGLVLIGISECTAQYEPKPLSELDRLPSWYPISQPGRSLLQGNLPAQPNTYTSFSDLLQKAKTGSKIEALVIDGNAWKRGDVASLRELPAVRVLHMNGLTAPQIDSLFHSIQDWSLLERLTVSMNYPLPGKVEKTRSVALPINNQRFEKLHDVRLNGNGIQWGESIKALAGLKTLRYLEVSDWQNANSQSINFVALPQLTRLKINGLGLEIKSGVFANLGQLSELTLSNARIDTATFQRSLKDLPHLETLVLENTRSLRKLNLSGLKNLKSVELGYNPDLYVEATAFAGLSGLERLIIRSPQPVDMSGLCSLTHLHTLIISGRNRGKATQIPDCIGQLNQLTELRIDGMHLDQLPSQIGSLGRLQKLSLTSCGLDSLPATFSQLTNLQELVLTGNKLRQFPNIGQMTALQQLNVSNNQLTVLPDDIGRLIQLKTVDASQNKLTQLPGSLGRLGVLRVLSLSGNQLERLPDELGQLRKLQTLWIGNNQLTALPNSLGQLDSLQRLVIGKNRLRSLPNGLARLKSLTSLYVENNELTALPAEIGELRQLTELRLDQLSITELPASICNLKNLQTLNITGTPLRLLPDNIGALTKLRQVILTNNELIALPNSIGQWTDVTNLSLERNKLEGLPNAIGRLNKLNFLSISGKDKVMEGSTGGLQQLPDSIVNCAQLSVLTIQQQPQLDAEDVFTKAARMKRLTHLTITNCNINRLPAIDWKSISWHMLVLSQNLLTELPVGLLDAPMLQNVFVRENRLPEPLDLDFHDKEGLRVAFVEAGVVPLESLSKPNRKVAIAYQRMSSQKAQQRDWEGVLSDLGKAIDYAPDTTRAFPYGQRASFHFFRKEYPEALADFDKAIQYAPQLRKDTSPDTSAANRLLATYWQQKAAVFGITGQYDAALGAITQAESFLPASDNGQLGGLIHTERGRYLVMKGKQVDADSSYRKAIRSYEKLTYADPGIRLTIVELSLLTGQYERAQREIANLPAEQMRDGFGTLKEYLESCLAVLKDEQNGTQAMDRLTAFLAKHPAKIYGWSFDLFDNWLTKGKLPAEKVTALRQLTDLTKERLVKPQ